MIAGAKLLLLQVAIMAIVPISDPRGPGKNGRTTPNCDLTIPCGQFQEPPSDGVKMYKCVFNKKYCRFTCTFKCKRGPNGKRMKISDRRHRREHFHCVDNVWTRKNTPQGYCLADVPVKKVEQNLKPRVEFKLIDLANKLFHSSFEYLAMALFYERADAALPGFSKLMTCLSKKDMNYARELMTYVNMRGGCINITSVNKPSSHEDLLMTLGERSGTVGSDKALRETRYLNGETLDVVELAKEENDAHSKHFLEDGLLDFKVNTIKKLADLKNQLEFFTTDEDYKIGEFSIDVELRDDKTNLCEQTA